MVREPIVAVDSVSVVESTEEAMKLLFQLTLTNPGDEPLELNEFRYTLRAEGREVYEGRRSAETTLAARAEKTIDLPAIVPLSVAAATGALPGEFRVELVGTLHFLPPDRFSETLRDIGLYNPDTSFARRGTVTR